MKYTDKQRIEKIKETVSKLQKEKFQNIKYLDEIEK